MVLRDQYQTMTRTMRSLMLPIVAMGAAFGLVVRAQIPATAVPTPVVAAQAPVLDELERSYLQIVNLTQEKAESDCQNLPSVQRFNATLVDVLQKIEARHPGYTLDRAKGVLVVKAAK